MRIETDDEWDARHKEAVAKSAARKAAMQRFQGDTNWFGWKWFLASHIDRLPLHWWRKVERSPTTEKVPDENVIVYWHTQGVSRRMISEYLRWYRASSYHNNAALRTFLKKCWTLGVVPPRSAGYETLCFMRL